MDLFCFQDKFICLDKPIAVFAYNQRVALATVRFLKSAGSFLDEARVSWYSFLWWKFPFFRCCGSKRCNNFTRPFLWIYFFLLSIERKYGKIWVKKIARVEIKIGNFGNNLSKYRICLLVVTGDMESHFSFWFWSEER